MGAVSLMGAGVGVDGNEIALAQAYGATKAAYAVCRMVQDREAVDRATAERFARRCERTAASLLDLAGQDQPVATDTLHALIRSWAVSLVTAASYLEAHARNRDQELDPPADAFDAMLRVGAVFEADLGGHPACDAAVQAAFA